MKYSFTWCVASYEYFRFDIDPYYKVISSFLQPSSWSAHATVVMWAQWMITYCSCSPYKSQTSSGSSQRMALLPTEMTAVPTRRPMRAWPRTSSLALMAMVSWMFLSGDSVKKPNQAQIKASLICIDKQEDQELELQLKLEPNLQLDDIVSSAGREALSLFFGSLILIMNQFFIIADLSKGP